MDFSKLETKDWLIGGGGVALFVFSWFPWLGKDFGFGVSVSETGWDNTLSLLGVLVGLAVTVWFVLDKLTEVELPELPLPQAQAYLIGCGVTGALVLLQVLIGHSEGGLSLDRKFGAFLAVIAAGAMCAGAFMNFQESKGEGATGAGGGGEPTEF